MYYKVEFDIYRFKFWAGAKDRMDDATPEQIEKVAERIEDCFSQGEMPDEGQINDLVWFECDDIFFPEENEDEEDEEEENEDNE